MSSKQDNVVWHDGHVTLAEREHLLGQHGRTLWLTGLSAAGKSTLAFALEKALLARGRACYVLDGDNVRHGLNRNLGFSAEDRAENIRRIAEVARLMNDAGLIVISAFISPYRADRHSARTIVGTDAFREIFVSTSLATCEARDPKGMYGKARSGQITQFTGISAPYEAPEAPDLILDTAELSIEESVARLVDLVEHDGLTPV
jgi:adenylyl-sulfate kinase